MTKSTHKSPVVNAPTDAAAAADTDTDADTATGTDTDTDADTGTDAGTVWSVRGSGRRRTACAAAGVWGSRLGLGAWYGLITPPAHPHP